MYINNESRLKLLQKQERYLEILKEFGIKYYIKYTPYKFRKDDYEKLSQEKRYDTIRYRYGNKKYLQAIYDTDIKQLLDDNDHRSIIDKHGVSIYKKLVPTRYRKSHEKQLIEDLFRKERYLEIRAILGEEKYKKYKQQKEKDELGELRKQGNYTGILREFGPEYYRKYTPSKHKENEYKQLESRKRYDVIRHRYGDKKYLEAIYDTEIRPLLENKDYHTILERYGASIYKKVVPIKDKQKAKKQEVKLLYQNEDYEEARILSGRRGYKRFIQKTEENRIKDIRDYKTLLDEFGPEEYRKRVPYLFKRRHIKQLAKEGRFADIEYLYGNKELKKHQIRQKSIDIQTETGSDSKGYLYAASAHIRNRIAALAFSGLIFFSPNIAQQIVINHNYQTHKQEIDKYYEGIRDYVEETQSLELKDEWLILMRAMNEARTRCLGYSDPPKLDIMGYRGLDASDPLSEAVCRNFAPYLVDILNETDNLTGTNFNAILLTTNIKDLSLYMNKIVRKNVEEEKEKLIKQGKEIKPFWEIDKKEEKEEPKDKPQVPKEETEEKNEFEKIIDTISDETNKISKEVVDNIQQFFEAIYKEGERIYQDELGRPLDFITGNHVIALVYTEDGTLLAIDPTNPTLGVFKNGEVRLFSQSPESEKINDVSYLWDYFKDKGLNGLGAFKRYRDSFSQDDKSFDELQERYGKKEQDIALDIIREKEIENEIESTILPNKEKDGDER